MMINKKTGRTEKVPDSRFNIDAHLHENNERPGSFNVPGGYFLNSSLQEFDPALFNISPIEAMWMDPQQRKLLEVVYEAFENGGIPISTVENTNTAVYIGSFTSDFQQMSFKEPDFRHSYAATGTCILAFQFAVSWEPNISSELNIIPFVLITSLGYLPPQTSVKTIC